jgi:hypothetical protein
MRPLFCFFLAVPLLALGSPVGAGKPDVQAARDLATFRAAGLGTDNAALLRFFRNRTLSAEKQEHFRKLVKQLGSSSYGQRAKATAALVKMGPEIKGLLLAVKKEAPNDETARRTELCLGKLEMGKEPQQAEAAARLLARRKPAGAARVLLDYLPFAAEAPVIEEVRTALTAVAARGGKPEPVVVKALASDRPVQRAAAAEALARARVKGVEKECVKALAERDPHLRLQVALALLDARRPEALAALVELVRDLPAADAWRAEEALRRVAGEHAPQLMVDRTTPGAKVRDAWQAWWDRHGCGIDLARRDLTPRLLGYTLISQMDANSANGRVLELGPDKTVKWEIAGLRYPVDAQVVRTDRVLIAEYLGRRVTERDFKGNVIWERQVDLPIACQPLPNGQTFVATRRQLLVLDRDGKDVFTYHHTATSISAARRQPDGHMLFVSGATCVRLDPSGKQVKSFPVGLIYTMGGNIDVLPGGHVLVPEYNQNRVVEYDGEGVLRWSVRVKFPISAVRLPNGNTLVVSMTDRRVLEFDREGREVWSHTSEGRMWRARKR